MTVVINKTEPQAKCFCMTHESIEAFAEYERHRGTPETAVRRMVASARLLYSYLPDDKVISKERLVLWRDEMNQRGYAIKTVQNYAKNINRYLKYVGLSEMCFKSGRPKDISQMTFGYITAIEPTEKRDRNDIVWRCICKCGNEVEIPASRLIRQKTLSCGCINKERIRRMNKYIDNTSLEKSLTEKVYSNRSQSGYVGVTKKRDRWQAYITYKGRRCSLGVYSTLEEAVKARAKGKEQVMADAAKLLKKYQEIHSADELLPNRSENKTDITSS